MNTRSLTALLVLVLVPVVAAAQQDQRRDPASAPSVVRDRAPSPLPASAPVTAREPNTDLEELVRQVAARSGQEFLIGAETPSQIYVGGIALSEVTYPLLLTILSNNGLAGVEVEGRINVVPERVVRSMATQIVQRDDADIPDDLWVTRIIEIPDGGPDGEPSRAAMLVPVLRPLMPITAHLSAYPDTGSLIIVDRYINVRRMTAIIEQVTAK